MLENPHFQLVKSATNKGGIFANNAFYSLIFCLHSVVNDKLAIYQLSNYVLSGITLGPGDRVGRTLLTRLTSWIEENLLRKPKSSAEDAMVKNALVAALVLIPCEIQLQDLDNLLTMFFKFINVWGEGEYPAIMGKPLDGMLLFNNAAELCSFQGAKFNDIQKFNLYQEVVAFFKNTNAKHIEYNQPLENQPAFSLLKHCLENCNIKSICINPCYSRNYWETLTQIINFPLEEIKLKLALPNVRNNEANPLLEFIKKFKEKTIQTLILDVQYNSPVPLTEIIEATHNTSISKLKIEGEGRMSIPNPEYTKLKGSPLTEISFKVDPFCRNIEERALFAAVWDNKEQIDYHNCITNELYNIDLLNDIRGLILEYSSKPEYLPLAQNAAIKIKEKLAKKEQTDNYCQKYHQKT